MIATILSEITGFVIFLLVVFMAGCSGSASLSQEEKEKLAPALQEALNGVEISPKKYDITYEEKGTRIFGVIIKAKNSDEIRGHGIRLNTVQNEMMTAKLSAEEIRQLIQLTSVIYVELASKSYINQ